MHLLVKFWCIPYYIILKLTNSIGEVYSNYLNQKQ